jgi:hypothetical protein
MRRAAEHALHVAATEEAEDEVEDEEVDAEFLALEGDASVFRSVAPFTLPIGTRRATPAAHGSGCRKRHGGSSRGHGGSSTPLAAGASALAAAITQTNRGISSALGGLFGLASPSPPAATLKAAAPAGGSSNISRHRLAWSA